MIKSLGQTVAFSPTTKLRELPTATNGDQFVETRPSWSPPSLSDFSALKATDGVGDAKTPVVMPDGKTLAWGDFALGRHKPGTGHSYFTGTHRELAELIKDNWAKREPGVGRSNLDEVICVPVPAEKFMTTVVSVGEETPLLAKLDRRRAHEAPFLKVSVEGEAQPAKFAKVVLYSAETLAKGNERSVPTDWELVSVVASPVENEPMDPVTMMRNMMGEAGGTRVEYSAQQLLESIEFWSTHAKIAPTS